MPSTQEKQITTEEMRELLARYPEMSAPTRHVLVTGQAVFVDADGTEYRAPLDPTVDRTAPTHTARAEIVSARTGDEPWN